MTELRELTDTELEAVYGGIFDVTNVIQANTATQVGVAIGGSGGLLGGNGGAATVGQFLAQVNFSSVS
jgi:bacteriocin-like protein